jgi:hypothetical protein
MTKEKEAFLARWEFNGKIGACRFFLQIIERDKAGSSKLASFEILNQVQTAVAEVTKLERLLRERFKK